MTELQELKKIQVLIVDDEPEDLALMADVLKQEGYTIHQATSGQEALDILQEREIHILLVDILMPKMTGYSVCKEVRKRFNSKPIQIVLVTGLTVDHYLEKAIEVGGDDFIYKPINILELQRRIKAARIRLRTQMNLVKAKEKLEEVVEKKEEFSNKVLRENQKIKDINTRLVDTNEELKIKASYDMLSGLLNKMSLFTKMDEEIARSIRGNNPLTGIMLDVDHFKHINDTHGHQAGDEVIKEIGQKLKSCMRVYDNAGRFGGEEFFMILSNTNLKQGHKIGERFRMDIEKNLIQYEKIKIRFTVSLGIAQYKKGESKESWLNRADMAMYKAKQLGRNCSVLAE